MTLYGFSRKDIAKSLSGFAKKNLVSGYPTEDVLQHGLGEFYQGGQVATDMELYAFISPVEIPGAAATIDGDGSIRMQAVSSPVKCSIYKPYPRGRQGLPEDFQDVDVEVIQTGKGAAEETNYGDAAYYVYNTFPQAIPANTISFCAVFGGVLFAIDKPPQKRVRFRLKTSFNDQGVATAYVLDQFGDAGLSYMDTIEVCDPRKLFAHAIGADSLSSIHTANPNNSDFLHAGGSVGYAIWTSEIQDQYFDCGIDCVHPQKVCYSRYEVEQCTQIADKMRVEINPQLGTDKITGELSEASQSKTLRFLPQNAFISRWPYVDYPPEISVPEEGVYYEIEVLNPHLFTALNGWAVIERVEVNSRLENADNRCVPYSPGQTALWEWHIVDVQKPIARWICASFQGSTGNWEYVSSQEGHNPNNPNYFEPEGSTVGEHILTHECLEIDCLKQGQKGVGYWDPNSQNYQIISTNSALYGSAVDIEAVAQKVTEPPSEKDLLAYDGCDLNYRKMSPFKVFGANDQCPAIQSDVAISPSLVPVEVVSGVDRPYVCTIDGSVIPAVDQADCLEQGGVWEVGDQFCFTYNTVYVCQTTPGPEPECIDVCCDEPPTPPADECLPCDFCDDGGLEYDLNGIAWDSAVQSGFAGRALINTAVWTAGAGDCDATLTVEFETDEPNINNIAATASVSLSNASALPACSGGLEINLSWSPSTVFGITLPTVMGQGLPSGCAGQYGLNNCGVLPYNPDTSGNWDNIVDITITDCAP